MSRLLESYLYHAAADYLVEAFPEGRELLGDMLVEQIVGVEEAVVLPVLVVDLGHAAVLNQLLDHAVSEVLELDVEVEFDVFHVFGGGEDVLEGAVDVGLDLFQVLDDLYPVVLLVPLVEDLLVDDLGKVEVEVDCVVDREAEQHAHELEPERDLEGEAVEPVEPASVLGEEHVEVGVEDGLGDQGEVLVPDPSLVGALLADELYLEGALEVALDLAQLLHRVVEDVVPADSDEQEDESVHPVAEVHVLQQSGEPALQVLFYVDFLFVDRFDLNQLELVVARKQEGEGEEIKIRVFLNAFPKGLQRVDDCGDNLAIEVSDGYSLLLFVAEVEEFEVVARECGLAA